MFKIIIPLGIPFIMGMMRGYSEKMDLYLRSGKEMNASLVEYVRGMKEVDEINFINVSKHMDFKRNSALGKSLIG